MLRGRRRLHTDRPGVVVTVRTPVPATRNLPILILPGKRAGAGDDHRVVKRLRIGATPPSPSSSPILESLQRQSSATAVYVPADESTVPISAAHAAELDALAAAMHAGEEKNSGSGDEFAHADRAAAAAAVRASETQVYAEAYKDFAVALSGLPRVRPPVATRNGTRVTTADVTDALQAGQISLPQRTMQDDNELLVESGTHVDTETGRERFWHPCVHGDQCMFVRHVSHIAGRLPRKHKVRPLAAFMTVPEMQDHRDRGVVCDISDRPCLLCMRAHLTTVITRFRVYEGRGVEVPATGMLHAFINTVGAGSYAESSVMRPRPQSCFGHYGPVAKFNLSSLAVHVHGRQARLTQPGALAVRDLRSITSSAVSDDSRSVASKFVARVGESYVQHDAVLDAAIRPESPLDATPVSARRQPRRPNLVARSSDYSTIVVALDSAGRRALVRARAVLAATAPLTYDRIACVTSAMQLQPAADRGASVAEIQAALSAVVALHPADGTQARDEFASACLYLSDHAAGVHVVPASIAYFLDITGMGWSNPADTRVGGRWKRRLLKVLPHPSGTRDSDKMMANAHDRVGGDLEREFYGSCIAAMVLETEFCRGPAEITSPARAHCALMLHSAGVRRIGRYAMKSCAWLLVYAVRHYMRCAMLREPGLEHGLRDLFDVPRFHAVMSDTVPKIRSAFRSVACTNQRGAIERTMTDAAARIRAVAKAAQGAWLRCCSPKPKPGVFRSVLTHSTRLMRSALPDLPQGDVGRISSQLRALDPRDTSAAEAVFDAVVKRLSRGVATPAAVKRLFAEHPQFSNMLCIAAQVWAVHSNVFVHRFHRCWAGPQARSLKARLHSEPSALRMRDRIIAASSFVYCAVCGQAKTVMPEANFACGISGVYNRMDGTVCCSSHGTAEDGRVCRDTPVRSVCLIGVAVFADAAWYALCSGPACGRVMVIAADRCSTTEDAAPVCSTCTAKANMQAQLHRDPLLRLSERRTHICSSCNNPIDGLTVALDGVTRRVRNGRRRGAAAIVVCGSTLLCRRCYCSSFSWNAAIAQYPSVLVRRPMIASRIACERLRLRREKAMRLAAASSKRALRAGRQFFRN